MVVCCSGVSRGQRHWWAWDRKCGVKSSKHVRIEKAECQTILCAFKTPASYFTHYLIIIPPTMDYRKVPLNEEADGCYELDESAWSWKRAFSAVPWVLTAIFATTTAALLMQLPCDATAAHGSFAKGYDTDFSKYGTDVYICKCLFWDSCRERPHRSRKKTICRQISLWWARKSVF